VATNLAKEFYKGRGYYTQYAQRSVFVEGERSVSYFVVYSSEEISRCTHVMKSRAGRAGMPLTEIENLLSSLYLVT
jgi:hypothetical protein